LLPCPKDSSAVSVNQLPIDDVLGNSVSRLGFVEIKILALCYVPDLTPPLAVRENGYDQQRKGTTQQANPKPLSAAEPFVICNISARNGASRPKEEQEYSCNYIYGYSYI